MFFNPWDDLSYRSNTKFISSNIMDLTRLQFFFSFIIFKKPFFGNSMTSHFFFFQVILNSLVTLLLLLITSRKVIKSGQHLTILNLQLYLNWQNNKTRETSPFCLRRIHTLSVDHIKSRSRRSVRTDQQQKGRLTWPAYSKKKRNSNRSSLKIILVSSRKFVALGKRVKENRIRCFNRIIIFKFHLLLN